MDHQIEFTAHARRDARKLDNSPLKEKVLELLSIVSRNPFQNSPPYEKLNDEDGNMYSRRINLQHRLVYQVFKEERVVRIHRMWTHYE